MKKIILLFCFLLAITMSDAQVVLDENFDDLTVGSKAALKLGAPWDTWSSTPGGADDASISDEYSTSPSNSLHLLKNDDIVLKLGGLTTGVYTIDFNMLIKSGHIGYFNVLHDFNGAQSKWGVQVFLEASGKARVDYGPQDQNFDYSYDTWIPVSMDIDMDDDFFVMKIDSNIVSSGLWSLGSTGAGINRLDAINFYGVTDGAGSSMFIDDIVISKTIVKPAPTDFIATLVDGKDVNMSWVTPLEEPDSYSIYKDDVLVADGITTTSYKDENIYPGEARYFVRALYDAEQLVSRKSDEGVVVREGGGPRELVLFEIGTGTGCPNCPSAARGVSEMIHNKENVAILEYHNYNSEDPFNCEASAMRTSGYYGITGYPTQYHDGTRGAVGGSYGGNSVDVYTSLYEGRYVKPALYSLSTSIEQLNDVDYVAHVTINENSDYYESLNKTLRLALTETDISFAWQGLQEIHFAVRDMYPDAQGTIVDFTADSEQSIDIPFTMDGSWVKDNCELVVFLQSDDNKEVLQTIKIDMETVVSGVEDVNTIAATIYPNPVSDKIFTSLNSSFDYIVFDIAGQKILDGTSTGNFVDVKTLRNGIYILTISTKDGVVRKKFVKE